MKGNSFSLSGSIHSINSVVVWGISLLLMEGGDILLGIKTMAVVFSGFTPTTNFLYSSIDFWEGGTRDGGHVLVVVRVLDFPALGLCAVTYL